MKKLLSSLAIALLLGGCSVLKAAHTASSTTVSQETLAKSAYAAKATYAVALVGAAQVVKLPRCEKASAPCVWQSTVNTIRKLDVAADTATQAAEDAVRNLNGDPTLMALVVDNASNAVKAFQTIVDSSKGAK